MEGKIDTQLLTNTAEAIRYKAGTTRKYSPSEFSKVISALETNDGSIPDTWDAYSIVDMMNANGILIGDVLTAYNDSVYCYFSDSAGNWETLNPYGEYQHYHIQWDNPGYSYGTALQGIYYFTLGDRGWTNCYEADLGQFIISDLPNYVDESVMKEITADIASRFTDSAWTWYSDDYYASFYDNLDLGNVFYYAFEMKNDYAFNCFFNSISDWERDDPGKIANGLSADPDLLNKVLYSLGENTVYEIAFENIGDVAAYIENNIGLDYFLDFFNGNDIAYYLAHHEFPNVVIDAYIEADGVHSVLECINISDVIEYIDEYCSSDFFSYYISNHGYEDMLSYVDSSDIMNYVSNNMSTDDILSSIDSGDVLSYVISNQSVSDIVQAVYDYNSSYDDILSSIGNDAIKEYLENQGYTVEE